MGLRTVLSHRDTRFSGGALSTALLVPLLFLIAAAPPALATLVVEAGPCGSYSVLPQTFRYNHNQTGWMGVAVGPELPEQSVFLRALVSESGGTLHQSEVVDETNFLVTEWTSGSAPGFVEAYTNETFNYPFLIDYEPGLGSFQLGGEEFFQYYGGEGWDCGLLRVWDLGLTAGHPYQFRLNTTEAGDDVRLALLRTGGDNGWLARADALVEWQAAEDGVDDPHDWVPPESGSYALVVFNNSILTPGGTYTLRVDDLNPPLTPDLVIDHIEPETAPGNTPFTVTIHVRNQGQQYASSSFTELRVNGDYITVLPTPGIQPGEVQAVTYELNGYPTGSIDVEACADASESVDEGVYELNNCTTEQIAIYQGGTIDLVIDHIEPEVVVEGESMTLYALVRNQGTAASGPSHIRIWVEGTPIDQTLEMPSIGPGQIDGVGLALGAMWTTDDLVVYACADEYDEVVEEPAGAEDNNCSVETVYVIESLMADLVVDHIAPDAVDGGDPIEVVVYVQNIGAVAAPASQLRLWVDDELAEAWVATPAVGPGQVVAAAPVDIGTYWHGEVEVRAQVNVEHDAVEGEYEDTTATETIEVITPTVVVKVAHPAVVIRFPLGASQPRVLVPVATNRLTR